MPVVCKQTLKWFKSPPRTGSASLAVRKNDIRLDAATFLMNTQAATAASTWKFAFGRKMVICPVIFCLKKTLYLLL